MAPDSHRSTLDRCGVALIANRDTPPPTKAEHNVTSTRSKREPFLGENRGTSFGRGPNLDEARFALQAADAPRRAGRLRIGNAITPAPEWHPRAGDLGRFSMNVHERIRRVETALTGRFNRRAQ
jgi:hypothetical protein